MYIHCIYIIDNMYIHMHTERERESGLFDGILFKRITSSLDNMF